MAEPFYITTAISYPNGRPHIGHAYEAIATDAIARFQRLKGRDVFFLTGTDEHGLKMAQAARERGVPPAEFASEMSALFKQMDDDLNISYDRFIRTTEPEHHEASRTIWQAMADKGDIYLDRYEGWYSVRDEAYYGEEELVVADSGEKLSPQGTLVEWTVEESWFFRLSAYQERLLAHYAANPEFIRPESRLNEVLRFVEGGLADLSISRTSFDWGVKVPGSEDHVMYVWLDALTNYLTGIGYPEDTDSYRRYWPADIHIIGKDVVRFHAVYWPAFLMSAGLTLPKQVFGHGHVLLRGEKMSKSAGNVVDPLELVEAVGVDPLRYFLLREISFGQDGTYSADAIVTRTNADLANSFGNLAQRSLGFITKNCDGILPLPRLDIELADADKELIGRLELNLSQFLIEFELSWIDRAILNWMASVYDANAYIDTQAPWKLKKSDTERMNEVLATLYHVIANLALAIQPIIPSSASRVLDQLGVSQEDRQFRLDGDGGWQVWDMSWYHRLATSGFALAAPSPIFPRLELPADG